MYTLNSRVRYSECDEYGKLTLLAMTNYLQDCSIFHAESIDRGVEVMRERHIAWLLAAWQIEIVDLPKFCDEISVSTWCHTIGRSLASRNFVMSDADGNQLVRAEAIWFVYDHQAGRAIRIPEDLHVLKSDDAPLDMPKTERRLPVEGPYVEAPAVTVVEMHLDSNHHVNNAQYLEMAVNSIATLRVAAGDTTTVVPRRICTQYKNQAHLGDVIVPRVHTTSDVYTVDLVDEQGASYAIVRIETS